jgi:hypothetical protein
MKPQLRALLGLTAISAFFLFWLGFQFFVPDPDRLYHLAISREVAMRGPVLANIPQAEDIGWARYFPEKEFLHHVFTGLGFYLGKENGAAAASHSIALSVLLLVFWISSRVSKHRQAFFLTAVFVLSPFFLSRIAQMKPFEWGVFSLLLILFGFQRNSRWLSALGGMIFSLSYHLLPMPLAFIGCFALFEWRSLASRKLALFALLGLFVGILANPYFPSNLATAWQILWIGWRSATAPDLNFGIELLRLDLKTWLLFFGVPAAFSLWAIIKGKAPLYLRAFTLLLWFIAYLSPRGVEYALPFSAILLAFALPNFAKTLRRAVYVLGCVFFMAQYWMYLRQTQNFEFVFFQQRHNEIIEAVKTIPGESGKKVFHCGWEHGPYVFYLRPDLRFVDLLDPSYLYLHDKAKWETRKQIKSGVNSAKLAIEVFDADYLLCDSALKYLKPIYHGKSNMVFLYKLR